MNVYMYEANIKPNPNLGDYWTSESLQEVLPRRDPLRIRVLTYGNIWELIEQIDWHIAIREEVVYKLA